MSRALQSNRGYIFPLGDAEIERFRVLVIGTDDDHVAYADGADDRPVGISGEGTEAAEQPVALQLLGVGETPALKMASTGNKGDRVVPAVDGTGYGKVLPTAAGSYWVIGRALEDWAAGQEIAIEACQPYQVVVQAHIADPTGASAQTQDALTDNSGGTAGTTIASIGATYAQSEVANAIATLAAQLAKVKTDVAAVRTASEANNTAIDATLVALETAGVVKTS